MDNLFDLPPLPKAFWLWREGRRRPYQDAFGTIQMHTYAREAQDSLIGRLAQMQEHEAIEWLLKARQDWWKS